jgi:hypothetical protein
VTNPGPERFRRFLAELREKFRFAAQYQEGFFSGSGSGSLIFLKPTARFSGAETLIRQLSLPSRANRDLIAPGLG